MRDPAAAGDDDLLRRVRRAAAGRGLDRNLRAGTESARARRGVWNPARPRADPPDSAGADQALLATRACRCQRGAARGTGRLTNGVATVSMSTKPRMNSTANK